MSDVVCSCGHGPHTSGGGGGVLLRMVGEGEMKDACVMLAEYAEWRAYGIGVPLGMLIMLALGCLFKWITKESSR